MKDIGTLTLGLMEEALKRVQKSADKADLTELAAIIIKLTDSRAAGDEFWSRIEHQILCVLIERELQMKDGPSFARICKDAEEWNLDLENDEVLKENMAQMTEKDKQAAIRAVQLRLGDFAPALAIHRHLQSMK